MTDDLFIRRGDPSDVPKLTELFQLIYRNSSHPLQNLHDECRRVPKVIDAIKDGYAGAEV